MNVQPITGVTGVALSLNLDEAQALLNYLSWGVDILEETLEEDGGDPGMTGLLPSDVGHLKKLLNSLVCCKLV